MAGNLEDRFDESSVWFEEDEMLRNALLWDETGEDEEEYSSSGPKKQAKRKSLARCHACKRDYYSFDGFRNHLKSHIFEDVYRGCLPMEETFMDHCREKAKEIIKGMASMTGDVGITGDVKKMANLLCSDSDLDKFVDCIAKEIWDCLPPPSAILLSKFHNIFVQSTNHFLADQEKRKMVISCLSELLSEPFPLDIYEFFFGSVSLKLAREAEAYILKCMREPQQLLESAVNRDDVNDEKFQQSVYYVGGSTVKSVLRLACRSNDKKWNSIVTCISEKCLVGPLNSAPISKVTEWTNAVDRGGLKCISEKVFVFLMALSTILVKVEEDTGSVLHEKVMASVKEDPVLLLWDDILEGSLDEETSDLFLEKVCYFFVNTWGAGVALRRKNEAVAVTDKAPFRSTLLPRKS